MIDEVWVLDFEAEAPEGGNYFGRQSVHRAREGAEDRFRRYLAVVGVAIGDPTTEYNAANAADGSWSAEMEFGDVKISVGLHRVPIEE